MYNLWSNSVLTNVTFNGNTAVSTGGGMYNIESSPTLMNVTFSANSANFGGGMQNNESDSLLTNVTFSSNQATSQGGGMQNTNDSNPTLTNTTFSNNAASFGGGMSNLGTSSPQIRNTIFWGNTGIGGAQIYIENSAVSHTSVSYGVVQAGCPDGVACTGVLATDPLLGMLGNYGGLTQTIRLLAGSSAIDTGNDAVCPLTDQRGVARPQGSHCDIGAYEIDIYGLFLPLVLR
jgi:hypothetical protein